MLVFEVTNAARFPYLTIRVVAWSIDGAGGPSWFQQRLIIAGETPFKSNKVVEQSSRIVGITHRTEKKPLMQEEQQFGWFVCVCVCVQTAMYDLTQVQEHQ